MVGHPKVQPILARGLGPDADDVLVRPDPDGIPGLILGVPAVEVVVVVGQRHEVLGARLHVELHQGVRIPVLRVPGVVDVLEAVLGGRPVAGQMVLVLWAALDVHVAGVPVALLRLALGRPMRPDAELGVPEPVGRRVVLREGFPAGLEWPGRHVPARIRIERLLGFCEAGDRGGRRQGGRGGGGRRGAAGENRQPGGGGEQAALKRRERNTGGSGHGRNGPGGCGRGSR